MNVLKLIYILDKVLKMMCCRKIALNTKFTGFWMQNLKRLGTIILACWSGLKKIPGTRGLSYKATEWGGQQKPKPHAMIKTPLCSKPLRAEHIRLNFAAIFLRKTLRQLLSNFEQCTVMLCILLPLSRDRLSYPLHSDTP